MPGNGVERPLNWFPTLSCGSKIDTNYHMVFLESGRNRVLEVEPHAEEWFIPYKSARDFLYGSTHYVLKWWEMNQDEREKTLPVIEHWAHVTDCKQNIRNNNTSGLSQIFTEWSNTDILENKYVVFSNKFYKKQDYIPADRVEMPWIPEDTLFFLDGEELGVFGITTSKMYRVWTGACVRRLKKGSDYSFSSIYNTFPPPRNYLSLDPYARNILDVRARHPKTSLADMCNESSMPDDLLRAHQALDKELERLYREGGFASDEERLECLLQRYKAMVKGR